MFECSELRHFQKTDIFNINCGLDGTCRCKTKVQVRASTERLVLYRLRYRVDIFILSNETPD